MDAWNSIRGDLFPATKRPAGGITQAEYAKRYGVTGQSARWQLQRLEEMGRVTRERVSINGKVTNVYIPVRRLLCNASTQMKSGKQPRRKTNSTLG